MKRILSVFIAVMAVCSCTKHDPFDNYRNGEFVDPSGGQQGLWILSKFAKGNVSDINNSMEVSFYDGLEYMVTEPSYYYYSDLKGQDMLDKIYSDGKGSYWRMPTSGELKMAFPELIRDEYTASLNMSAILIFSWSPTEDDKYTTTETAYLDNDSQYGPDASGEVISGESVFFYAEDYEDDNPDVFPIYALRFKGTSQYAAYRYEIKSIETLTYDICYLNLKAKWLKEADTTTTIEDISNDAYWASDFLELNFRMDGYMDSSQQNGTLGIDGVLLSNTYTDDDAGNPGPVVAEFYPGQANLDVQPVYADYGCNIRMINCKEDGSL